MARYTGPTTKKSRTFGEIRFLEMIGLSSEESILPDNMDLQKDGSKSPTMLCN